MIKNTEITALFQLMDDPDEEVFSSVSQKLLTYGTGIIPNLEDLWEHTLEEDVQQRIESIIHKLQFNHLHSELKEWAQRPDNLFTAAFIISKYVYPNLTSTNPLREIEQMRRNIWLELNSYQDPLKQVEIISGVLFVYFKIQGVEIRYQSKDEFLFHKVLETGKGNAIANGILLLILCGMLDVPVHAVGIPQQFLLGYFDVAYDYRNSFKPNTSKLSFFVDPLSGQIYSRESIESYLKKSGFPPAPSYFRPVSNKKVIEILLKEMSNCYSPSIQQKELDELGSLIKLLKD